MRKSPFSKDTYRKNAQIYKIMANRKRLEILNFLKAYGETIVEDLVEATGMRKSNVSQHLASCAVPVWYRLDARALMLIIR